MKERIVNANLLRSEISFSTSRSSGPGGQNVNKVNSKVILHFNVLNSSILTGSEKQLLSTKLATQLTSDGELQLSSQEKRSQLQNKEEVLMKFDKVIARAMKKQKPRKPTSPSKGAKETRLKSKKQHGEKKRLRRGDFE